MARVRDVPGNAARALEFTILTAVRAGEGCGARWSEIEGDVWVIPRERMKKGDREHRVPLSQPALDVLAQVPDQGNGLVFPGRADRPVSVSPTTIYRLAVELGAESVHGFRSAFRDWAEEQTSFSSTAAEIALAHRVKNATELALAHRVGNSTENAYRRGDMLEIRREIMAAWGRHCAGEPASGVVVPIGARRHG
jgi:integrase